VFQREVPLFWAIRGFPIIHVGLADGNLCRTTAPSVQRFPYNTGLRQTDRHRFTYSARIASRDKNDLSENHVRRKHKPLRAPAHEICRKNNCMQKDATSAIQSCRTSAQPVASPGFCARRGTKVTGCLHKANLNL